MKETLYDILGILPAATPAEVKKAYRELSKSCHPDKVDESGASSRQAEINHAYEILSDPAKRMRYDETGQDKDVAADQKLQNFLASTFVHVIEGSTDVESNDLIGVMKAGIESMIDDCNKSMRDCAKRQGKLQKVLKRLKSKGDKNLIIFMERQIDGTKQEIGAHEEHRNFMRDVVMVVLDDYNYEFTEAPEDGSPLQKYLNNRA